MLVGGLALGASYFALPAGVPRAVTFLVIASAPLVLLTARLRGESLLKDRNWALLLGGVGTYTAAAFLWYLVPLVSGQPLPFPSLVDPLYFGSYVLYGAFLVRGLNRRSDRSDETRPRALPLVDAGIFAIAAMSLLWPLLFAPLFETAGVGILELLTGAGYPFFVALLFGLVTQLVAAGRRLQGEELLLVLWVGAELVSDVFYGVVSAQDDFHFGHPMMLGWMVSYSALAAAAVHPSLTTPHADSRTAISTRTGHAWILLPAVLAPVVVMVGLLVFPGEVDAPTRVAFITFVVSGVVLAFIRLDLVSGDLVEQRRLADALLALTQQLEDMSLHDDLTGLGNRRMLLDRLRHATDQRPTHAGARTGVLLFDLDGFKAINDTLGHDCGDEALIEVARRVSTIVRPGDTVTRLGGDEFAVIVEHVDPRQAARAAERVVEALRPAMTVGGQDVFVSASVGIDLAERGTDPQECLKHADLAMYAAKEAGGDRSMFFDAAMEQAVLARVGLDRGLRLAIGRDELRLLYEPIVELHTGSIVGVKALLRWEHPERGMLHPHEFMAAAEDSGAIVAIGRWALEQSCRQAKLWALDDEMPDEFTIAVSITRHQLREADIVGDICSILEEAGVSPGQFLISVTEALFADGEHLVPTLADLRALGVTIALEDFGAGHSTLHQLRGLPIDVLELDRLFTADIHQQPEDDTLTAAVVGVATSLGKCVLAQGIDTPAQLAHISALDVDLARGPLFGRPLDSTALADVVKASSAAAWPAAAG